MIVRDMSDAHPVRAQKAELRAELLRARRGLTPDERKAASAALRKRVREMPELANGGTAAAYMSMGSEPGTRGIVEDMLEAGIRLLLPVLRSDNDLDWAEYQGHSRLERTQRGLLEPTGERLGPQAISQARTILLPGLAVDSSGVRLGRGGGSYDRVLNRLKETSSHPSLVVLLYEHEVIDAVPRERHDHCVHAAVTPSAVRRFVS